ncbi:hypothetical protein ACFOUP_10450 [Belliella kenyensis]|uniref:Uncharacterized protein n=1 Tax=Belliella kenyensis TaxID=1472724 RepID=A0ABV8EM96_9BACT|nr:hypothetical protein [Belliella kenyensis]MCH7400511.1 hypothetical protein [Belliella kenyensis]MDN3604473.1 hypothetical protein [Belliella kenyensis]
MVINSLHGTFSIVINEKDQDKLLVKAKSKAELTRIFDENRVRKCQEENFSFFVSMCKQEFAHTLIMMIKEINYLNFEKYLSELDLSSDRIFA